MSVDPDMAPELEAIIDHEHLRPHQPLVEQRQPIVLRARTTATTVIQEMRMVTNTWATTIDLG